MSERDAKRHCGFDNCKSVFVFYVVLFHAANNWYIDESTKDWPPLWADIFKSYTVWHEKLAVPGFAFLSGFFGKKFLTQDGSGPWRSTISVLLVGTLYVQLFVLAMECIMMGLLQGEWVVPSTFSFWDNLETWYLLALLLWRFMTPILPMLERPLLASMGLAFMHAHVYYGEPSDLRMRIFRFFPYYVLGLHSNKASFDKVPRRTIVATLGVISTFVFCLMIKDKQKYLGLNYTYFPWSWESHLILLLQYVAIPPLIISVILLVAQISFPIFPCFHSHSTLAIYTWHWYVLPTVLYGKFPFSAVKLYQGMPLMEFLQKCNHHPVIAILSVHVIAYVICCLLGSRLAWKMLRHISDPNCEWIFRSSPSTEQSFGRKPPSYDDLIVSNGAFTIFLGDTDSRSASQPWDLRRRIDEICKLAACYLPGGMFTQG
jgi:hypothetical protein